MASDYLLDIDGIKGELSASAPQQPMSLSARQKLQRWGMTSVGIAQLAAGVPVSNANDRRLVERVVARAMRPL